MVKFRLNKLYESGLLITSIMLGGTAFAQTGSVSNFSGNYASSSGSIRNISSETLHFGAGTYEINGIVNIYSKNIIISPNAVFTGTGRFNIYNRSELGTGYTDGPTLIDGNGSTNELTNPISLHNNRGLVISEVTGNDLTLNVADNSLYISDITLEVNGANVILGTGAKGDLTIGNGTINNFNVNRMIVTNNSVTSHLIKKNQSGNFTYPVGIAIGDYTPVKSNMIGTFHVSVVDYSYTNPLIPASGKPMGMNRIWHMYSTGTSNITNTTFVHNATTNGTSYLDDNAAYIVRYNASNTWDKMTTTRGTSIVGEHIYATPSSTFIPASNTASAYFTKSVGDQPLPIKLINFDAHKEENFAKLTWSTANEYNNKGFEIERSSDSRNWENIDFTPSLTLDGNSNSRLDYVYFDQKPQQGNNYYRLKQVDFDGNFEYTPIRMLQFSSDSKINIYPNPANNLVNVDGLNINDKVYLFDATGRLLNQTEATETKLQLSLDGLSNGNYQINIINAFGHITTHKLIILN